eukprot:648345-Amphidinium_carterae.1
MEGFGHHCFGLRGVLAVLSVVIVVYIDLLPTRISTHISRLVKTSFHHAEGRIDDKDHNLGRQVEGNSKPRTVDEKSTHELVWVTICAPPGCTAQLPALQHLERVSPLP